MGLSPVSLALSLAFARKADTPAIPAVYVCIVFVIWMLCWAMGLNAVVSPALTSANILRTGYRFKVQRVAAMSNPAQMVNYQPIRYGGD